MAESGQETVVIDGRAYIRISRAGVTEDHPPDIPDAHHRHVQDAPATEWRVAHALGKYPAISATDSSGRVVHGDVLHESKDVAVVKFSAPFSGTALAN